MEEAKSSLFHSDIVFQGSGDKLFNRTLIVIAEHLLTCDQSRLEELRGRATPLSASDSLDAEHCRRRYMGILKDFYGSERDLKYSFYKYSLWIADWNEALAREAHESNMSFLSRSTRSVVSSFPYTTTNQRCQEVPVLFGFSLFRCPSATHRDIFV